MKLTGIMKQMSGKSKQDAQQAGISNTGRQATKLHNGNNEDEPPRNKGNTNYKKKTQLG